MPGTHSPNPVLSSDFPSYRADRAGPRMRGAPNFAARKERASARNSFVARGKIGTPAPRHAAPSASLTRPDRRGAPAPSSKRRRGR